MNNVQATLTLNCSLMADEPWGARQVMQVLLLCEESGSWQSAATHMNREREKRLLDDCKDEDVRLVLESFKVRLTTALAHEKKHGRGCLRNMVHPTHIFVRDYKASLSVK